MKTLIKNIKIINSDFSRIADVLFSQKIEKIGKNLDIKNHKIIDGTGKILMPALIDPHVHFRDPGFTHKEDFFTGSSSAVAGGVGTVFDMPNTNPAVFSRKILAEKGKIIAKKSLVNFGLFFGAGIDNLDEIAEVKNVPATKMYLNTTTGNLKMDDEKIWEKVFKLGKKVALHAEGDTFLKAVEIWEKLDCPCELHLCHASLSSEVQKIRELKQGKFAKKISMEVCPHHLLMTDKEIKKHGAFCCMKPQLATQSDIDSLWEGVEDGTVDFFATDHAPHTRKEKINSTDKKPVYGIPGVETLFPLIFTEFKNRNLSLEKFVSMTSQNIVEKFHIKNKKGQIRENFEADLILIEENFKGEILAKNLHSKCGWTPFENYKIRGKILQTFVNGNCVFDNGKFCETWRGEKIEFEN